MKFSVITPCYNSEKTIERTILSVVNQKNVEIEYIIVDGASQDNTVEIIKKYSENFPFIKYISEKDESMTQALNKGFKLASGEVICTVNADDEFEIGAFEVVKKEFSKNQNIEVLVGNTVVFTDRTKKVVFTATPKYFSNLFLTSVLDCPTPECSVFSKRKSLEQLNFYNEEIKYTQDYDLYIRMIKNKLKIKYIDVNLSKFYLAETQFSIAAKDKMLNEVKSYVPFKKAHLLLRKSRINGLFRTLLRIRKYESFNQFKIHLLNKHL